jgi:hypothetical protein
VRLAACAGKSKGRKRKQKERVGKNLGACVVGEINE